MTSHPNEHATTRMDEQFLQQYSKEEEIRKYTKETAGAGISYLLENVYGRIYLDALTNAIPKSAGQTGVRLLEFGCGAGMNLIHLVSVMERRGIPLQCAYGADFSPKLIEAANEEARKYLSPSQQKKVRFCVGRNENLAEDVAAGVGVPMSELLGSFHMIVGVNTFRYSQRLKKDVDCASAIFDLLADGGMCIMIDMNNRFPLFRTRFRDRLTKEKDAIKLPSLDEYAQPFSSVGFEIVQKKNFCWIPHSAGNRLTAVLKGLTPVLDTIFPNNAMRSLVISRKPERRGA